MNKNVSQNFLLLKDYEQIQILQYLSKDFRKRNLFNHFQYLYTLKIQYLKNLKRAEPIHKPQLKTQNKNVAPIQKPEQQAVQKPVQQPQIPKEKSKISKTIILRPTLDFSKYISNFLVSERLMSIVKNKTIVQFLVVPLHELKKEKRPPRRPTTATRPCPTRP